MKYNLNSQYDFEHEVMKTPERLISDISQELGEITKGYVKGNIEEYEGRIESYDRLSLAATLASITTTTQMDIQDKLGIIGDDEFKYEFYLSSSYIDNFKFRVLFLEFGIGGYPVKVVLEQGIADEIRNEENSEYIFVCNTIEEFETLFIGVLNSKKVVKLIQDLITATNRKLKLLEEKTVGEENNDA